MQKAVLAAAAAMVVVLGALSSGAVPSAFAATGAVRSTGHCAGGGSTYVLTLWRYNATTLRIQFRIEHSTPGQTWQIFGSDNGSRIFAVKRVVSSVRTASVRRLTADRHGTDKVKVATNNVDSGEACSATVRGF